MAWPSLILIAVSSAAHANGAFPDAQTVLLPSDHPAEIIVAANFGLVTSDDDGNHWQYTCEGQATLNGRLYSLGPAPDGRMFSLSDRGIATTADRGCVWILGAGPFEGGRVFDYFADPVDPRHVLAVAAPPGVATTLLPARVFESRDGGLGYNTVLYPGVAAGGITGVEIARSEPATIYLTTFETSASDTLAHPRLVRSSDAGATWQTIDLEPQLGPGRVSIAAVSATDARRLYLRVSGVNAQMRSVDSIAVSSDGGDTFTRPLNLTGGTLIAFIARQDGTVLASGLLGATVVGYRSVDGGMAFEPWHSGIHPRGFGERGTTLFAAADDVQDGFALASSEDNGDTWTPRMRFADIQAVKPCAQQACADDCWQKVTFALWAPAVCGKASEGPSTDGGAADPDRAGCRCSSVSAGSSMPDLALATLAALLSLAGKRSRRPRTAGALVAATILLAASGPAFGYVRSRTISGSPYHWATPCIPIRVHLTGLPGVSDAEMRAAVTGAARAWTAETNACTNLAIALSFDDGPGPRAGNDGVNVIGARGDGWCQATDAMPPDRTVPDAKPDPCNAPSATAASSVFARPDGLIQGADIDLNTITFSWAALDDQGQPAERQDLQSALTHELGHLIGLGHPCWSGIGERAVDDGGAPVPDCYAAPAELVSDTMFPTIDPGDMSKRVLSPDAQRALCEIYPSPSSPGAAITGSPATACRAVTSGCSLAPIRGACDERRSWWPLLMLVVGAGLRRPRRQRNPDRPVATL